MTTLDAAPAGADRQAALSEAMSGLRVRQRLATHQWLLVVGGVLLPLGLLLMLLGWWGASRTPRLFEQVPYLISGGLIGLGLVVSGGFVYFAYWLTVLVRDGRAQGDQVVASLARIEELLATAGALATTSGATPAAAGEEVFVATSRGSLFHRPDCPVVAGKDGLRRVSPDDPDVRPCKMCAPVG